MVFTEPLGRVLENVQASEIAFDFAQLAAIVGREFPDSAKDNTAYWSSHDHCAPWLTRSWKAALRVREGKVRFERQ